MSKVIKKAHAVADLESAIVRVVRARGEVSRSELARDLDLVASTTGIYVDRLISRGYLVESKGRTPSPGRPPVMISLNPRGGRFIGVDFDASQILAVAVDFTQEPLAQVTRKIPPEANPEGVLEIIEEAIGEVMGPDRGDILGIGVGVPGVVDPDRGISRSYRYLPEWRDVPIQERWTRLFQVPVFVENNSRALALGELWCGQGRGMRNLVCLNVRQGIGSGIIVDGSLLRGSNNQAGEVGGWVCPEAAVPGSVLGKMEEPLTIEDVASVSALMGGFQGKGETTVSELLESAEAGQRSALKAVKQAAAYHGWVMHQLALVFDPERLIVAGPMVESRVYQKSVRSAVARLAGPEWSDRVFTSSLGPYAGALGASALAFHLWRPGR